MQKKLSILAMIFYFVDQDLRLICIPIVSIMRRELSNTISTFRYRRFERQDGISI